MFEIEAAKERIGLIFRSAQDVAPAVVSTSANMRSLRTRHRDHPDHL